MVGYQSVFPSACDLHNTIALLISILTFSVTKLGLNTLRLSAK
jgi:hypothetical protein